MRVQTATTKATTLYNTQNINYDYLITVIRQQYFINISKQINKSIKSFDFTLQYNSMDQNNNQYLQDQVYVEGDLSIQDVSITTQIGRGNSDVFLGMYQDIKVAIKKTQIKTQYQYHSFVEEISMLKSLSDGCTCIVKYQGYFVTSSSSKMCGSKRYGYLLMEQAQMNIAELIKSKSSVKSSPTRTQISTIVSTLLIGFSYLQNINIAHCDIKPQNILITSSKNPSKMKLDPITVKICDVGSCKTIDKDNENEATIKGTLSFLAPQLIKIEQQKITSINAFRSDVYSFGLVLLYLVTGKKFNSVQRKEIKEEVYLEIVGEWIKYASQILFDDHQIIQILRKSLESDQYKRPLFKQLKVIYDGWSKKNKILRENKLKKLNKVEKQQQTIEVRKQEPAVQRLRLPKIKGSNSSTLISFHSRQRLTGKIPTVNLKPQISKKSSEKSSKSRQKSRSKNSPLQKTTTYSNFSMDIDKSKLSIQMDQKRIFSITQQNHNIIPYQNINQSQKIFVLYYPSVQFQSAYSVVIKKMCTVEVFDKLAALRNVNSLYLEYDGVDCYGTDQNTPTVANFQSVFINLENSVIGGGYNNLLRCLCPISLRNLQLQFTGSSITYQEVRLELQRIKTKQIQKLDLCWDNAPISPQQFSQLTQKISRLPLKKLILSLSSSYLKPQQKSRWLLPATLKTLYLNMSNNFFSKILINLSISLSNLKQLKQLYLNLQNNNLNDTDIKIVIKTIKNIESLEKVVVNLSWNGITNGVYCLEEFFQGGDIGDDGNGKGNGKQIGDENRGRSKISSLEIRLAKCQVKMQQFQEIFLKLIKLFHSNLKILKITYDRLMLKSTIVRKLDQIIKQEFGQGLKLNIIGYDYSYFMIYVKKKSQPTQKNIRIKTNPQNLSTSTKQNFNTKKQQTSKQIAYMMQNSTGTNSSKTIQHYISTNSTAALKNKKTESQISVQMDIDEQKKVSNKDDDEYGDINKYNKISNKNNKNRIVYNPKPQQYPQANKNKICQSLFSKYPSYQHYICLDCIQSRQNYKNQYFCRACIQSCQHKDHYIVRTYEKKICNCPYNHQCTYIDKQDNYYQVLCTDQIGVMYKRQFQCQRCYPNSSLCMACIQSCQDSHVEFVSRKGSVWFECQHFVRENQKERQRDRERERQRGKGSML